MEDDIDIRITKLLIHPIKSCRGISVSESRYDPKGLQFDRQYLIVDTTSHKCITAREIPKMILVETAIESDDTLLRVSFPKESQIESFTTPLIPNSATLESWEMISDVEIWLDTGLNAYIAQSSSPTGPSPSSLLSSFLGRDVLLVLKGPKRRAVVPTSTHPDLDADVRFQDGFPLLLATTESLFAVQERIRYSANGAEGWKVGGITPRWQTEELAMERFRPNIVLSGSPAAFDEDYWGDVQIGEDDTGGGVVSVVKRCGRCLLPNVDTNTGIRDNAVPFKVITRFRRVDSEPGSTACFGVNGVTQASGVFRLGDRLRVLSILERETLEVNEPPIPVFSAA
ncbi:importin-9 [Ceratobasidium sp. AG-Ba]|nr:importin-9 [Ceratobasidium sp. AG-Ba]